MNIIDEIESLFRGRGVDAYFGESVSVTEHLIQTAYLAQLASAAPALVLAALLHDVGHLIMDVPNDIADWDEDAHHERLGGIWLAQRFPPEVSEPVRLHVCAKRYLLATDPSYLARLSPASVTTLQLQGGPMTSEEVAAFEAQSAHQDAVRLRRWDDAAKVAGWKTPAIGHYAPLIERLNL